MQSVALIIFVDTHVEKESKNNSKIPGSFPLAFLIIIFAKIYFMPTTAQIVKAQKPPKYKTRIVRRCFRCGRKRWYMRKFGLCRICFKELAYKNEIPGLRKASW